eukprot:TRINITY_DN26195_c0_g1_i2.p1 TRINITY_DN26195_c0_g1~~TRINITY_DN26195_c0_g1_i2.p1  ORF type:complete len:233 (-),score=37.49 TRINITY_DN26195_c0_g1_i2:125-823(-)
MFDVSSIRVWFFFFFFKQKTAYEMLRSLVGSEMCIRDRLDKCPLCDAPGILWCRDCRSALYCSRKCRREHRRVHKEQCRNDGPAPGSQRKAATRLLSTGGASWRDRPGSCTSRPPTTARTNRSQTSMSSVSTGRLSVGSSEASILMHNALWDGNVLNVTNTVPWPLTPYKTRRRLRVQAWGKKIGYPYEGAFGGQMLYEAPFPGALKHQTGLRYSVESVSYTHLTLPTKRIV